MTSSAASDTDSARNRTCGRVRRTASSTARPPPSGMCTSSSTTSGSIAPICATASATVLASPTTLTCAPNSARTPARNIAWSSTRKTRSRCSVCGSFIVLLHGQHQPDLGAVAQLAANLGVAAVAPHASDYRSPYAVPIILYCGQIEPNAPVPYENTQLFGFDLGVERHGRGFRVPGRVDKRLTRRGDQRTDPFVDVQVAAPHRLYGDRDRVLALRGALFRRGGEPLGRRTDRFVEPVAQRALLPPGQPLDRLRIACVALHQRQRMQHLV